LVILHERIKNTHSPPALYYTEKLWPIRFFVGRRIRRWSLG